MSHISDFEHFLLEAQAETLAQAKTGAWQIQCLLTAPHHNGEWISLLTPEELARIPNGVMLISIHGQEVIKGTDYIDMDTRAGYLAYGTQDA